MYLSPDPEKTTKVILFYINIFFLKHLKVISNKTKQITICLYPYSHLTLSYNIRIWFARMLSAVLSNQKQLWSQSNNFKFVAVSCTKSKLYFAAIQFFVPPRVNKFQITKVGNISWIKHYTHPLIIKFMIFMLCNRS